MPLVICKTPRAGLGNQLFPIMKAFTFGYLNNLKVKVFGFDSFMIGPYLRGEKVKRNYKGFFKFEKSFFHSQISKLELLKYCNKKIQFEPALSILEKISKDQYFIFKRIPAWKDNFLELRDHRELIIKLFYGILKPEIVSRIESKKNVSIGVHIRMGDYRKLRINEQFKNVGLVRTPLNYFFNIIRDIRLFIGYDAEVTIFTDGWPDEVEELLKLPSVNLADDDKDIVHLLQLSKSKLLILSAGSTFGEWAGFLSDAIIIRHPEHIHSPIRNRQMNDKVYEGPIWTNLNELSPLLKDNLRSSFLKKVVD